MTVWSCSATTKPFRRFSEIWSATRSNTRRGEAAATEVVSRRWVRGRRDQRQGSRHSLEGAAADLQEVLPAGPGPDGSPGRRRDWLVDRGPRGACASREGKLAGRVPASLVSRAMRTATPTAPSSLLPIRDRIRRGCASIPRPSEGTTVMQLSSKRSIRSLDHFAEVEEYFDGGLMQAIGPREPSVRSPTAWACCVCE